MKYKKIITLVSLFIFVGAAFAYKSMPGGPRPGTETNYDILNLSSNLIQSPNNNPFPINYNSYFYTFQQAHIFSYHNGTNFAGFWTGTLNQDQYQYITTSAGVYSITGSEPYSLLSGQALVAGYFAKDENGKGVANKFLTYMPAYNWGGEKFVVFGYTSGTHVYVTNLNGGAVLADTFLNDGERLELTTTTYGKWLKVEATNPVSALSYADQEYNVPSRTGEFVGTDFYTWVGYIGGWQNDLNIVAWHDSTNYVVTDMATSTTIASGLLNRTQIGCVQTIVNKYVRVTSDKKVSVSVAPYLSFSGAGYARFTTMRDSTGFGAGNYFVFPVNGSGTIHMLSYRNNNTITLTNLNASSVLWTGTLNAGQNYALAISGSAKRIEVTSSDLTSVDLYYSGYGADFAPLEFSAPGHDVGVTQILAPIGLIPNGTIVTPKAVVHNFSSYSENFIAIFSFTGYSDTQNITGLAAGATDTVDFDTLTATPGFYSTVAYSRLAGDQTPSNDTAYGEFYVEQQTMVDVGVTSIIVPTGTYDPGVWITPAAIVHNYSQEPSEQGVEVPVSMTFNDDTSTQTIQIGPGETDTVYFDDWMTWPGSYDVTAYTALGGDPNLYNDTAYSQFDVTQFDVGVTEILSPVGTITAGTTITPQAIVTNFSGEPEKDAMDRESIPVYMHFGSYISIRKVLLGPGETDMVTFDDWTAIPGNYQVTSFTALAGDPNPYNDTAYGEFTVTEVSNRDVAVISILVPADTAITCNDYTPQVVVANFGTVTELCTLNLTISRYPARMISYCHIGPDSTNIIAEYNTPVIIELAPGYDTIDMPTWHPYWWDIIWIVSPTNHHAFATISTDYDINLANNSALKPFIVKGRINDIQMNWTGLLDIDMPMHAETIGVKTYNVASVVSVSQGGTNARFRAYAKIIKENGNTIVYSRYKDLNLPAGTYYCVPFQSGWSPSATGWYKVSSWIQALPQYDAVTQNNNWEKRYYVMNIQSRVNNDNHSIQGDAFGNGVPSYYDLLPSRPNPISGYTKISWQIPSVSDVVISVFDASGRNITTLVNGKFVPGYYNTIWDCTNGHNQKVAAGIYFYEMRTSSYTSRLKMVIAK